MNHIYSRQALFARDPPFSFSFKVRSKLSDVCNALCGPSVVTDQGVCQLARPSDCPPVSRCLVIGSLIHLSVRWCVLLPSKIRWPVHLSSDLQLSLIILNDRKKCAAVRVSNRPKGMYCFVASPANQHLAVRHHQVACDAGHVAFVCLLGWYQTHHRVSFGKYPEYHYATCHRVPKDLLWCYIFQLFVASHSSFLSSSVSKRELHLSKRHVLRHGKPRQSTSGSSISSGIIRLPVMRGM